MTNRNEWLTLGVCLLVGVSFGFPGCSKETPKDEGTKTGTSAKASDSSMQKPMSASTSASTPATMPAARAAVMMMADGDKKGTKENPWTIGMSQCNRGEPWRKQMDKDIEAAAKAHDNIKVLFKDAQNKTTTQQDQVREFITQKVDLLIISPKESKPLTEPVAEAMDAGIPVIVLDRAVEGDKYTCFIGADNKIIGKAAGQYIAKILNGKGKVVEFEGLMTSKPGEDRHNGFMEGLGDNVGPGKIEIIYKSDCQWLEDKANKEMQSVLSKFDDIDLVYGHNDPMAHGAYTAADLEGKGREKTIKFIGIDALPDEGVQYVKNGILTATFYYPTLGPEAIETALKILKGEKVDKTITLGTKMYTKDNVDKGGEVVKP